MTDKTINEPKSFSEHVVDRESLTLGAASSTYNDGRVEIASDANDREAFSTAILQNTAVALTDPYLAPDGTYTIQKYPKSGPNAGSKWKIIFSKENGLWTYAYWAHPAVHEMFMKEVERRHHSYQHSVDRGDKEYLGQEMSMPPYIAKTVEYDIGHEFGSEDFKKYVASHEELQYFWIDKKSIGKYRNK